MPDLTYAAYYARHKHDGPRKYPPRSDGRRWTPQLRKVVRQQALFTYHYDYRLERFFRTVFPRKARAFARRRRVT